MWRFTRSASCFLLLAPGSTIKPHSSPILKPLSDLPFLANSYVSKEGLQNLQPQKQNLKSNKLEDNKNGYKQINQTKTWGKKKKKKAVSSKMRCPCPSVEQIYSTQGNDSWWVEHKPMPDPWEMHSSSSDMDGLWQPQGYPACSCYEGYGTTRTF